jgi:hypothetical protein
MNRRTVLTSAGAGHPFRRSLPARVLAPLPQPEPEVLAAMARAEAAAEERLAAAEKPLFDWESAPRPLSPDCEAALVMPAPPQRSPLVSRQDVKQFLMAYSACFLAVSAFIS